MQKVIVSGSAVVPRSTRYRTPFLAASMFHKSKKNSSVCFKPLTQKPRKACTIMASATPTTTVSEEAVDPMNIVFISAEISPWSKTGGLGDVVGSLPVELAKRGHQVFTIAPRYDQYWDAWDTSIVVDVDGEPVRFFHSVKAGVHRVWVDHPWFLAKVHGMTGSKLYGAKSGADYVDNQRRFALFCKAAIESLTALPFMPGEESILVANDWHSALVPVLLKDVYQPAGQFTTTKCALTIHNVAFQGRFWPESFGDLGLPESSIERFAFEDGYPKVFDELSPAGDGLELAADGQTFKKINWLRAGITACDQLLTVSPNYATEMCSGPALGVELNDVITEKGVQGIVNGMDVADWNPALDKFLSFKYDGETVESGKAHAKAALQRKAGVAVDPTIPVFGFIGRLEEQKGVDILLAALDRLPSNARLQIVILGTGKASLEAQVKTLEAKYPGVAVGVVKFDAPLAHIITAGADFMVVPSRFEPCGLIQLHAMAYGTVPLVASTGGLVDTVKEGVTGFQMGAMDVERLVDADAEAVASTILRAAEVYGTPGYNAMRDACIAQDLSWAKPAIKWEAILAGVAHGKTFDDGKAQAIPTPVEKLESPATYPDVYPKPSDVAAAAAAAKDPANPAPNSPAAVIAAAKTVVKAAAAAPVVPKPTPTSGPLTKETAVVAAKASVTKAPAPSPPKTKATPVAEKGKKSTSTSTTRGATTTSPTTAATAKPSTSTSTTTASASAGPAGQETRVASGAPKTPKTVSDKIKTNVKA